MKKNILIIKVLFLLLFSNTSLSQEKNIFGIILDSLQNPIQYANIGILNKPIGTVSNKKGEFNLILDNSYLSDTLKISCLGYVSKELLIKNLLNRPNTEGDSEE